MSRDHLSETWYFVPGFCPGNVETMPEKGTAFSLKTEDRLIDLDSLLPAPGKVRDNGTVYNRFTLNEETSLAFGICCDWWFELWFNGKLLYTTFPGGNAAACFGTDNHLILAKGKKGANLLTIHVCRGRTWIFGLQEKDAAISDPCTPVTIHAYPAELLGPVKPMNAVNNGPIGAPDPSARGNFMLWKEARIPFARNHDASFCSSYGGEHSVDISAVFPDFSADPEDPASYDFDFTDDYLERTLNAGTQIFYRLGSKIEHARKKYGTKVPPDFRKWAIVCEHIIRHFNEGWANGHRWNILYWEIWNEPDLCPDDAPNKPTWQGTEKQFHEFFRVAACHLKQCFPNLKIGGPAVSGVGPWMRRFLKVMHDWNVPLDFFSWHNYGVNPAVTASSAHLVRKCLNENGYTGTESILNEWNYVRNMSMGDRSFTDTVRTIIGMKGAVYASSVMCSAQSSPLDMLMYYDARPCAFNGLFDYYTYAPLKTYYSMIAWSKLAELGTQFRIDTHGKNGIYASGAADGKGKAGIILSRYFEPDDLPRALDVTLEVKGMIPSSVRLLDRTHDLEPISFRMENGQLLLTMEANTMIYAEFADKK